VGNFRLSDEIYESVKERWRPKDGCGACNGGLVFPPEVMTGLAGDFAQVYSDVLEVPKHFLFISYLTCLGSVIANRVTLSSEIAPQPRLYVVLLGESADDRKSTAIAKTTEFFREALTAFPVCWGIGSAEGLQKKLEGNPGLILCFDEFKQFVSKCRIDGSVLLPCVNTLFESNRYESRTKTSEVILEKVYLSMLAASTVQTYERTWDSSFTDIGFTNRLFLVPGSGERRFSVPEKVPFMEKARLRDRLGSALRGLVHGLELEMDREAGEIYHRWYMDLEQSIHAKRLDTYALRFMVLMAANDGKRSIDSETVEKVIRLMDWQLEARRLHDPIDADGQMAKMEERIRRILRIAPQSDRDLKKKVHLERSGIWFYTQAIKNLQTAREIRWNKTSREWVLI